jgi:hypothetical protein
MSQFPPPINPTVRPKRFRRGCLYVLASALVFPLLLPLGLLVYNWRAKQAFLEYVDELEKIGESVKVEDFTPVPITNLEESFVGHPLISRLIEESRMGWEKRNNSELMIDRLTLKAVPNLSNSNRKKEVRYFGGNALPEFMPSVEESETASRILEYCDSQAADLALFAEAVNRPVAHFNLPYHEGFGMEIPVAIPLQEVARLLAARAQSHLILGDGRKATKDAEALLKLSDQWSDEPSVVAQLLRISFSDQAIGIVHDGISRRLLDAPTLKSLSDVFEDDDFEEGYLRALRMERATFVDFMRLLREDPEEAVRRFSPRTNTPSARNIAITFVPGWTYDNARLYSKVMQDEMLTDGEGLPALSRIPKDGSMMNEAMKYRRNFFSTIRYRLALSALPTYGVLSHRFLRSSVYRDHARIALALESHRMERGSYPGALDALADSGNNLNFTDPITNEPYRYRLLEDGSYLLYSVGLNRTDEGGLLKKDLRQGDWVWRLALPEDFDWEAYVSAEAAPIQ